MTNQSISTQGAVLFHEQQLTNGWCIGWAELNNSAALNSVTLPMAEQLLAQLRVWQTRQDVICVVLYGAGRAFCAGGDVRRMREGILAGTDYCAQFFETEYRLDYLIHCYAKPLLCWGHGIVMGGGVGLLEGASHRVVTPTTRMAMPEVNIGLYPDVGAGWFLNRLPPGLGLFFGITACEWNGADAVTLGLADYLLADEALVSLDGVLADVAWYGDAAADHENLTQALQALVVPAVQPVILPSVPVLAHACSGSLMDALEQLSQLSLTGSWFAKAQATLAHGCPVTMRLLEEQLRRSQQMTLAEVFQQEWILSVQCTRHPDFPEGVRAQLVDKDKQPRWSYATAAAVPDSVVQAHFLNPYNEHPLVNLC